MDPKQAQFDMLFRKHYQEIYRYVSGQYPAMADDIAQDTFLTLYDHLEHIQPKAVRAWLYRVAINKGMDAVRSSTRRLRRHEKVQPSLEWKQNATETQVLVRLVLDKLKPRDAQLLQLHSCGLSYNELADVLEVKPGSISQLLARAKSAFSSHYKRLQSD